MQSASATSGVGSNPTRQHKDSRDPCIIYICTEKTFIGRHFKQESRVGSGPLVRPWSVCTKEVCCRNTSKTAVKDIKLILSNPETNCVSYEQLAKYDQLGFTVDNQVELAVKAHKRFMSILSGSNSRSTYKQYGGIMYANITIFDDDAFIAFYNCTGVGDSNLTVHFNRSTNSAGYKFVEDEFLRMWNASESFGLIKKIGASILFTNNSDQILLFLRDDKSSIPFPNRWDILGGGVEDNETPLECITREMKEEIGISLTDVNLFNVYNLPDRYECTFWKMSDFNIKDIRLTEGQRLQWFTYEEIEHMNDDDVAFGFKPIILEFFQKRPFDSAMHGRKDRLG